MTPADAGILAAREDARRELAVEKHTATILALTTDKVMSVYNGKAHKCCCGCAGTHSYNSTHVVAASANRGDRKLAQSIVDLQALLGILGGKSQSLPNETLDRCQQSVDTLTVQIQGTLANEGIAYTRPNDCPTPVTVYRR